MMTLFVSSSHIDNFLQRKTFHAIATRKFYELQCREVADANWYEIHVSVDTWDIEFSNPSTVKVSPK